MDNGVFGAVSDHHKEGPLLFLDAIADEGRNTGIPGLVSKYAEYISLGIYLHSLSPHLLLRLRCLATLSYAGVGCAARAEALPNFFLGLKFCRAVNKASPRCCIHRGMSTSFGGSTFWMWELTLLAAIARPSRLFYVSIFSPP